MILKYQKAFEQFSGGQSTTHVLVEPDYQDGAVRATELCTIGDDTYVYWPDDLEMPEQSALINDTIEIIALTTELKGEIKACSPHVRLSYERLQERIRSRYSIEDEQYLTRISIGAISGSYSMQDGEPGLVSDYQEWVEESREIARAERAALGLA